MPVHNTADLYETLRAVLSEKFDIEPARIDPEARLDGLGLDYLAAVELLTDLENTCGLPAGRTLVLRPGATLAHLIDHLGTPADQ